MCYCHERSEPAPRHRLRSASPPGRRSASTTALAAERPPRERVDDEDGRDDGGEDAVDVDVERRRRLVVGRALSFPSVLDGTIHTCVMSSLSSTHSLQERRLKSSGSSLRLNLSFTTAGTLYCSRARTECRKLINFTTARRRRGEITPDDRLSICTREA